MAEIMTEQTICHIKSTFCSRGRRKNPSPKEQSPLEKAPSIMNRWWYRNYSARFPFSILLFLKFHRFSSTPLLITPWSGRFFPVEQGLICEFSHPWGGEWNFPTDNVSRRAIFRAFVPAACFCGTAFQVPFHFSFFSFFFLTSRTPCLGALIILG